MIFGDASGLAEAIYEGMVLGALLTAVAVSAAFLWLRSQPDERSVAGRPCAAPRFAPDPGDPGVTLARMRFAQGEIDAEELKRVLEALSRTWQA